MTWRLLPLPVRLDLYLLDISSASPSCPLSSQALLGLSKSPESLCQSEVRNRAHDHKMVAKRSRIEGMYHNCGIMTIRFRSTIIHNRVRVVVQGGLPPSHLNLCGSLSSGTERTICNNTRLTSIYSVTEILDLYARPRARKSSSFMPAISACRRECG